LRKAEARRASLRCSTEQYCRSTMVRSQLISLPHKKHIIEQRHTEFDSLILTGGSSKTNVLSKETLGVRQFLHGDSRR